jgi:UDP-N-acetylmuramyl pentapeptide phosphotransferase/UDP-N-acetylglucosamine-1-phosphate transferase
MGGGLFGTPLYLNPKCLVFSGFVLAVYWMPHAKPLAHRIVTAFMLATLAYVLLAWYDMIYDCNDKLGPTLLGWISMPFKPSGYRDQFNELPVKYQKIVQWTDILVLSVLLVLFVYPFIFTKQ